MHLMLGLTILPLLQPALAGVMFTGESIDVSNSPLERATNATGAADKGLKKCSPKTTGTCLYKKSGNTKIGFADMSMNFGNFVPARAVRDAQKACNIGDGHCNQAPISTGTKIVDSQYADPIHGTVKCYYTGHKVSQDMIDALAGAVHKTTKVQRLEDSHLNPSAQHTHSTTFFLKGKSDGSLLQIDCQIKEQKTNMPDYCSTFFEIADAVAGAINKYAGAGFKLFSLVCDV